MRSTRRPGQTAAIGKPPPRRSANFQAFWRAVLVDSGAQERRSEDGCPKQLGKRKASSC